jgi:uncharacterized phiE125 gp8 family phage protein
MQMSWLPTVVTAEPASEPVTLAEAKAQCRVDGSSSDTELNIYLKAARIFVEEYTGTKLVSQTALMQARSFCDLVDLPAAPIISVTSVKYLDTDGAEQTLASSVYELVNTGLEPQIRRKINQVWPSIRCASDAVRVAAVVGYSTVPEPIRAAILLIISSWFDNRNVGPVPDGAYSLLSNYRRF